MLSGRRQGRARFTDEKGAITYTEPTSTPPTAPRSWRRSTLVAGATTLLLGGVAAGAIVASTVGADAAQSSAGTASTASDAPGGGRHGGGHGLSLSGTVTAVGTNSVTIKTTTGTTTYGVDANSDIDKNGEATLSDLAVSDAVTFSTTTTNGATVIDKLHTGDEAKNKPAAPSPSATSTG